MLELDEQTKRCLEFGECDELLQNEIEAAAASKLQMKKTPTFSPGEEQIQSARFGQAEEAKEEAPRITSIEDHKPWAAVEHN